MLARKRRLEFKIKARKYYKEDYNKHATPPPKSDDPNLYDKSSYASIPAARKSMVETNVLAWMSAEDDLTGFGRALYTYLWLDIMTDGFYDYERKTYVERMSSRHNNDKKSPYYIDISLVFPHRTADDFGKIDRKYDFEDVFNISAEEGANYYNKYRYEWLREVNFYNVWDRHSCKIYSSFGNQSNRG
ncbi:hypothetical protein M9Y10_039942 [Tritrichomonas musculus]|uniref:Uncharacterized protein n=1 Tax=Tritrichomonas musculus TaxID=1915356 RepID=A0ABR2GQA8_9EUKA